MVQHSEKEQFPKVKITRESLKRTMRLFSYVGKQKWRFTLGMLFLFGTAGTALLFPWLMGDLVNAASVSEEQLNKIGLLLLVLFSLQAVFSYFRVVMFVNVTEHLLASLRNATYTKLIQMPMSFFVQRRVGELNSRLSADLSQIQDTFTTSIAEFLRQFIIIIGGIAALFVTSWKLALLMLAVVPAVAVMAVIFGRFIRKLSRNVQDNIANSNVIVEESLQGISNVKAFSNEMFEILRYSKSTENIRKSAVKGGKAKGAFFSFIIFCLFGAIILLVWSAFKLQARGEISPKYLTSFIFYTVFIAASIAGIAEQYSQIQKAMGSTERVMEILEEVPESINIEENYASTLTIDGDVQFAHVAFTYPSRKEIQVLRNISFSAAKGESVAIVGPSGAGKSTIVQLLLRFYEPDKGAIIIDGKEARNYSLTDLRSKMAVVPQDVLLFGGSIKENIAYGKTHASMDEIIAAAKKANALDFIHSFPEKFETIVGERGIKLSGGQRQRIAIARAVLKNPSILILDEATSSLDSESERLVQEALDKLLEGRTSFIIAHRLATVRKANRIVVIDKGEVRETGTHAQLIENENGLYRNLSKLQFELS